MDGSKEFRFIGINAQDVDPTWMKSYPNWKNEYSAPTDYELEDLIRSVAQMGGEAIRDYAISAGSAGAFGNVNAHVTGIGQFSEAAFKRLDKLLFYCNKYNVRLILGLTDYQDSLGGISTYTAWRGKSKQEFFTDPQVIADFKLTIDYVTNRYKNEKALLCWETGNEMPVNSQVDAWAREITAYIKSKDPNHLIEDGRLGGYSGIPRISADSLSNPNVDIVSGHYYHWVQGTDYATYCNEDKALTKNKKVYLVEEYGYAGADVSIYHALMDAAIDNGTSGVMIWALAQRSKNGGFYWHEGTIESMGNYWTYHWPGFFTGTSYNEIETLTLIRNHAYEIRGMNVPPMPVPDAPLLFNITKVSVINWRGSTGASFYDIERATAKTGPWIVVGSDVSDAVFNYTSLFDDFSATAGVSYYYRVRAKNASGTSLPSNVIGPVKAT
ncbi:MAG: cellulase family glycosylhydrolase [Saccharofermentanales bacterium]